MRRVSLWLMAVLALAGLIGAGSAEARLDPDYGGTGIVVPVAPPGPAGTSGTIVDVVQAPGGSDYVISSRYPCDPYVGRCHPAYVLTRYDAAGQLVPSFGGGGVFEFATAAGFTFPRGATVDSSGRLVYYEEGTTEMVVKRVTPDGRVDGTFGVGGSVTIPCPQGCGEVDLFPGPDDSTLVASRVFRPLAGEEFPAPNLRLIDLDASGSPSKRMPSPVEFQIPSRYDFDYETRTPGGGLYYGGYLPENLIERVSAAGRRDTAFARRAKTALRRLDVFKKGARGYSLVAGPKGEVELFGQAGEMAGFELRLRPNGELDGRFGSNGLKRYPFMITSAVPGSKGATMVLGAKEFGGVPRLYRILASGKIDPAFGTSGEGLPGATNVESGWYLAPAGKGRVTVVESNFSGSCRQRCTTGQRIMRFLEAR